MTVLASFVAVAQVGMCIDMQHGQRGIALDKSPDGGRRESMFTAKDDDELAVVDELTSDTIELVEGLDIPLLPEVQWRKGGDTDVVAELPIHLLIVELDVRGSAENGCRTV